MFAHLPVANNNGPIINTRFNGTSLMHTPARQPSLPVCVLCVKVWLAVHLPAVMSSFLAALVACRSITSGLNEGAVGGQLIGRLMMDCTWPEMAATAETVSFGLTVVVSPLWSFPQQQRNYTNKQLSYKEREGLVNWPSGQMLSL